ncbi:MAG TPA: hypothetical protein VGD78_13125 [Chthoniobacterales bacterium]
MNNTICKLAAAFFTLATLASGVTAPAQSVPEQVAALKTQVSSLEEAVAALQVQLNRLQTRNDTLQAQVTKLQSNNALALGPFVRVDYNQKAGVEGPNLIFSGVNIHLVSGSGATDDGGNPRGLGNLIIGYNEDPGSRGVSLEPGDRGGSHNLVIGRYHRFSRAAFGGFVAGEFNTIQNEGASVTGGGNNTASGGFSMVSGGFQNIARGEGASVAGGVSNVASDGASVAGGFQNTASGDLATVSGGWHNRAGGTCATVSGGSGNTADHPRAVVIGGQRTDAQQEFSIAPQPPFP